MYPGQKVATFCCQDFKGIVVACGGHENLEIS
jgi:hypothetical protein